MTAEGKIQNVGNWTIEKNEQLYPDFSDEAFIDTLPDQEPAGKQANEKDWFLWLLYSNNCRLSGVHLVSCETFSERVEKLGITGETMIRKGFSRNKDRKKLISLIEKHGFCRIEDSVWKNEDLGLICFASVSHREILPYGLYVAVSFR